MVQMQFENVNMQENEEVFEEEVAEVNNNRKK